MRFIDAKCVLETLFAHGLITRATMDEVYRQIEVHPEFPTIRHIIAHRAGGHPANYHATIYLEDGKPYFRVNETFAREWFVLSKLPPTFFSACY